MKFLTRMSLLTVFLYSIAFASEDLPVCGSVNALPGMPCRGGDINLEANQRISIYFHPISLIPSLAIKKSPVLLYLAGEFPMSRFNALVINPSLWAGGEDYFRLGSGVGFRRYANGDANGLYLQLMGSGHYLDIGGKSGSLFDILFYVGKSVKYSGISIYYDFGLGYTWGGINSASYRDIKNFPDFVRWVSGREGLAFDLNIGVGIPLF